MATFNENCFLCAPGADRKPAGTAGDLWASLQQPGHRDSLRGDWERLRDSVVPEQRHSLCGDWERLWDSVVPDTWTFFVVIEKDYKTEERYCPDIGTDHVIFGKMKDIVHILAQFMWMERFCTDIGTVSCDLWKEERFYQEIGTVLVIFGKMKDIAQILAQF